jgi:hypothetical protein
MHNKKLLFEAHFTTIEKLDERVKKEREKERRDREGGKGERERTEMRI